jgi:transposase
VKEKEKENKNKENKKGKKNTGKRNRKTYLTLSNKYRISDLDEYLDNLSYLVLSLSNTLLDHYYTPEVLAEIKNEKFYKGNIIPETINLDLNPESHLYLPNRFKRCLIQKVGEILKSQSKRRELFNLILPIIQDNPKIKYYQISEMLKKDKIFRKSTFVENIYESIDNFVSKNGRLPNDYFELTPKITVKRPVLNYGIDDGNMINLDSDKMKIKLPLVEQPTGRNDWSWFNIITDRSIEEVKKERRMQPLVALSKTKTNIPYYELIVPYEAISNIERTTFEIRDKNEGRTKRKKGCLLSVDTGIKKIASAVIMDISGNQLSQPIFIKHDKLAELLRLRNEISVLQKCLKDEKTKHKHKELKERIHLLWAKIRHLEKEIVEYASSFIAEFCKNNDIGYVVFENLKHYEPQKGHGKVSFLNSLWFRRLLQFKTEYKCKKYRIKKMTVSPYNTSRTCPKCNSKGIFVKASDNHNKGYHHFICPKCGFQGDRDYIGALNIGKRFAETWKKTVVYMKAVNPEVNRSISGMLSYLKHGLIKVSCVPREIFCGIGEYPIITKSNKISR